MAYKNLWDLGQSDTQEKMCSPYYIDQKTIKKVNKLTKHSMEDITKRMTKTTIQSRLNNLLKIKSRN